MDTDPFVHLSDDERDVLRMVLEHYRLDQSRGQRWLALWPSLGGLFGMPIPIPMSENGPARHPSDPEVVVSEVRAGSPPRTPPPATRVPQLDHAEEEECEDDDPDAPQDGDTALDEAIINVLQITDKPLKRITIANKAGYSHSNHLLSRLRRLVEQKRVKVVGGCRYWLSCRVLIPEE